LKEKFLIIKKKNYELIERQKQRKSKILRGYPYWLTIDPTNICNLKCVFCPTGQDRENYRPQVAMPLKMFKSIMGKIGAYLLYVEFCNWGEPLLNKNLPEMIKIAKNYGAKTFLSTNLNVKMDEKSAESLVLSGIERITISLDGASQETYEKYRRRGSFDLAIKNIQSLVEAKKRLNLKTPHLHWQFLVFKHNEHEIEKARAMSKIVGVDDIGFTAPFCSPEWVSTIDEYNNYLVKETPEGTKETTFKHADSKLCNWLWDAITVNADGSVSPCCSVEDKKDDFTNLKWWKPFFFTWNHPKFVKARAQFASKTRQPQSDSDNICVRCDHAGASNHKDITL